MTAQEIVRCVRRLEASSHDAVVWAKYAAQLDSFPFWHDIAYDATRDAARAALKLLRWTGEIPDGE